jgi:hypothetical protein
MVSIYQSVLDCQEAYIVPTTGWFLKGIPYLNRRMRASRGRTRRQDGKLVARAAGQAWGLGFRAREARRTQEAAASGAIWKANKTIKNAITTRGRYARVSEPISMPALRLPPLREHMPHEWIDPGLTTVFERCAAESERAACEAILRSYAYDLAESPESAALIRAADAIAARKGKGEGK